MGIALQYASVHERAGVALVSVAGYILLIAFGLQRKFPLQTSWETCAAPAPEARLLDLIDDLFRGHFRQCFCQRLVSVISYIFVDLLRVDDAAVPERYPDLALEEIDILKRFRRVFDFLVAGHEPFYRPSLYKMLIDDLFDILDPYHRIHNTFRIYDNDGAFGAKAETAGGDYLDFLVKAILIYLSFKLLFDLL